jgi:putative ABC transport system substrate-binding protein
VTRRAFLQAVVAGTVVMPHVVRAQSGPVARVGILTTRPRDDASGTGMNEALFGGLRDLGYVEGRNIVVDYPDAQGREDRLPALAAELVQRRCDVILVVGPSPLPAARAATKTIPLVMVASSADPVADGVAASLARPGGNVTGLTYAEPDRFKKQLEILKAAAPNVRRVGVLWDFALDTYRRTWEAPLAEAGRLLGLRVTEPVHVLAAGGLDGAFATLRERRADAVVVAAGGAVLVAERRRLAALALEHRLPGIAAFRLFPEAGLLMSYGPDLADINRRAGTFVARILKGAHPGTIPIELPSKFDLALNLATAASLGLSVPPSLLQRADRVVH